MKSFAVYTAARLLLFGACFGVIWLAFGRWLHWEAVSVLYTAIIAMVVSSLISLFALGSLRNSLAVDVSVRAERAVAAFESMRAAEDQQATTTDQAEPSAMPPVDDVKPAATDEGGSDRTRDL